MADPATSGHCPSPWVGRDGQVLSQPTAAAGAGPDFSCAGELEQPLKQRIGKMCRPSVGASVTRLVARSGLVGLLIPRLDVLCLGSSVGTGALDFQGSRDRKILGVSDRSCSRLVFCHRHCTRVPVGTTPLSSRASLLVPRSLRRFHPGSRAVCNRRWFGVAARCYITRVVPPRLTVLEKICP